MKGNIFVRTICYLFLIAVAITCLLPFYSMIITSTHNNTDIAQKLLLAPGDQLAANYERLMHSVNIWRGLWNTAFVTVAATALNVYASAMVGYGFSKYNFRFKNVLFIGLLATMMIPGQLGIIGFYKLMESFHMLNTYWPLILPSISSAFGVFMIRQFVDSSVPTEILESGRVDGYGEVQIFHRIILPLMTPVLATYAIFSFIGKWNDFLTPMIILFDNNKQTLPVMIASLRSAFVSDFGAQYVGLVVSVVPILVFFSAMSKRIISGVSAGAVKG
ncbi:carbohydrate ABC transporter permease [Cohnella pontilimi]|uniref:Carbohydrate ABC transporter permease n=1 Tax=Cohnella pontilimi TaxID=2564100 RepID=A0A4U0FFC4_9BACL|nr:carbohydrate ABC transporter permease [Cohnella pontilimi]TJY43567.1 carbohydrate ABC transporter permease [Cohnella pontilimi]